MSCEKPTVYLISLFFNLTLHACNILYVFSIMFTMAVVICMYLPHLYVENSSYHSARLNNAISSSQWVSLRAATKYTCMENLKSILS